VLALEPILDKLTTAQTFFFRAADAVIPEQWNRKPSREEWSAAELVAHLSSVERNIVSTADRVTQKSPRPVSLFMRIHLPVRLVESRVIRRKSPIAFDEALLADKEDMLADLRGARERSLAFLAETESRDLHAYRWKHPFLGMLNVYEWFEMIAAHQVRHTKQMKEISARLPKAVGISQKQ